MKKGWKQTTLGEICKLNYGKAVSSNDYTEDGTTLIYGTGGIIGKTNLPPQCVGPSIVIGRKGTINSPFLIDKGIEFSVIDTAFFLQSDEDIEFLFYWVDWVNLAKWNEASGVPSLSRESFYNISINLPPLPEQRKIASILRTWDEGAEKADAIAATYRAQKRGLMQQLLSGQVRVKGEDV